MSEGDKRYIDGSDEITGGGLYLIDGTFLQAMSGLPHFDVADVTGSLDPTEYPVEYISGEAVEASMDFPGCNTETIGPQLSVFGAPRQIDDNPTVTAEIPFEYANYGKPDGCF